MKESPLSIEISVPINLENTQSRLNLLKERKYLTNRVFMRISENMHYEIFKYLSSKDLLQIRSVKLGGFQLISNRLLRSRIQNYFHKILPCELNQTIGIFDMQLNALRIKFLFEQTGSEILNLESIGKKEMKKWLQIIQLNSQIKGLNLGNMYLYTCIYIYYIESNLIGLSEMQEIVTYLPFLPMLEIFNLSNRSIYILQ